MERSLIGSEDDDQFFPFCAHCRIAFQLPLNFDHQPETVAATKGYHMIITMNICVNRMVSDWRGIQLNVIEGDVEWVRPCDFFMWPSYSTVVVRELKQQYVLISMSSIFHVQFGCCHWQNALSFCTQRTPLIQVLYTR